MADPAATFGLLSLAPPVLAIGLALVTRQVFVSLLAGIWLGFIILAGGNPISGTFDTFDGFVAVFASGYNTHIIIFTLLIGALIGLVQYSGGVEGFVQALLGRLDKMDTKARSRGQRIRVELLALATGFLLFIESNISILTVGTVYRPITDRLGVPREKLAYITDSSSSPSCILIPFNAWGAYIAAQLAIQSVQNPFGLVLETIAFNFYPILVILTLVFVIISGKDFGPMKTAERRGTLLREGAEPMMGGEITAITPPDATPRRAINMFIPMGVMIILMPVFMIYTGWNDGAGNAFKALQNGAGEKAVLYAVSAAILVAMFMYRAQGLSSFKNMIDLSLKSMGGMLPLALLMVMAFALGQLCKDLGTGYFVAEQAQRFLSPALVPMIIFLSACFIAFAMGTSWTTFAIMIAIAVPLAVELDLSVSLCVAAALGGGIFGDHCSPISDTSIISSMATANDHIDHIRTQLPYALLCGGLAALFYLIAGIVAA